MKNLTNIIYKLLYAIFFLFIIPIFLCFWAKYTEGIIRYPAVNSTTAGCILTTGGGLLLLVAIITLIKYGKGLPMNAYPPPLFVNKGPYRLVRHPIYWGFGILMAGYFILTGSASGLWLVTPLTIFSMIALVLGYEKIDLKSRFPHQTIITVLDLPDNQAESPGIRDRFVSLFWILALLLFVNFLTSKLTGNTPALFEEQIDIDLGFENASLPFLNILFIILMPFLLKRKNILREWVLSGVFALSLSIFIALLFPAFGAQYLPTQQSILITVPIYLILISLKSIIRQSKQLGILFGFASVVLIIIQLSNSRSAIFHFASSILIFLLAANNYRIWIFLKNGTEKIANSWKEWVFGKVRVINHGFYVGFGAFVGLLYSGILAGKQYAWAILLFAFTVIVFSAFWAQIIEGSEKLKRPYGYYGALVGIIFASFVVWVIGFNVWIIIGVISVVMPWVQAIGRLRCLINGCCHGRRIDNEFIGIRYFHHRSRVCGISALKGELLHPTPLYAILWLFFMGFILLALWNNNFSSPFIFGLYLILTGIGRFVEEAYRGEVQTQILKGLRLYQWAAILSILIGIIMTVIQVDVLAVTSDFGWETFLSAIIGGLFTTFAMGVDFPFSNMRFSRLV